MKINVALPSSTISLSRSGFIRSSRCISLLLAAEHERTPFLFVPAADRFVFLVAKYCAKWLTGCSRTRMGSYCATYGRLCDPNRCIQRFALHSVYFATAKPTLEIPDVGLLARRKLFGTRPEPSPTCPVPSSSRRLRRPSTQGSRYNHRRERAAPRKRAIQEGRM